MTDKLIGIGKTVTGSLAGSAATNYALSSISTVTISAKIITGTGNDKTYNSLTTADISLNDVIIGDTVTVTGNFNNRDVASNKRVTGTIAGSDSGNYTLSSVSNASITAKTITGTSANRIYDKTTNVTVSLVGVEDFDNLNVSLSGSVTNKTVGSNKTVSGYLEGSRAFNYALSTITDVNISSFGITGSAANKVYDGSNNATVTLLGIINGDVVLNTSTFNDRLVGTNKTVSPTLYGADSENYTITNVATISANITAKTVTGT